MSDTPIQPDLRLVTPTSLDDIPTTDLPLETRIGTLGLFALDGSNLHVRAGGTLEPQTEFGTIRVNRIEVQVSARYRLDDETGRWEPHEHRYGICFRAGTATPPTRAADEIVRDTLKTAVQDWAEANPQVLAAAQHAAYGRDITDEQARIQQLTDEINQHQKRIALLQHARDEHAQRWTTSPAAPKPTSRAVGSVVYCGSDAAHYIVWADGNDVAWGVVDGLRDLPEPMRLDAIRAHLYDRDADTLGRVQTWRTDDFTYATGALDAPEVTRAAETVGDRIGQQLGRFRQRVTVEAVAKLWGTKSLNRGAMLTDEQPLAEALDQLAQPDTVRAARHVQLLRSLVDHATRTADRINAEAVASGVPRDPDIRETIRLIRQHLRKRSGRVWSVTQRRSGWIQIHALPSERERGDCMTRTDQAELGRLLDLDPHTLNQGARVPASRAYWREYIARAMGLTPTEYGTPYWD